MREGATSHILPPQIELQKRPFPEGAECVKWKYAGDPLSSSVVVVGTTATHLF
jgi:hypothetical protein